jgi:hypothetical protein
MGQCWSSQHPQQFRQLTQTKATHSMYKDLEYKGIDKMDKEELIREGRVQYPRYCEKVAGRRWRRSMQPRLNAIGSRGFHLETGDYRASTCNMQGFHLETGDRCTFC